MPFFEGTIVHCQLKFKVREGDTNLKPPSPLLTISNILDYAKFSDFTTIYFSFSQIKGSIYYVSLHGYRDEEPDLVDLL